MKMFGERFSRRSSRARRPARRGARRMLGVESLSGQFGSRRLRLEAIEPRLLLTNAAPLLNVEDVATFNGLVQNAPIDSNGGEALNDVLLTGGNLVNDPPPASYFIAYDTSNYGIAITRVMGETDGVWEYSTTGNYDWSLFPSNLSTSKALLLSCGTTHGDWVRFLPNANFVGTVGLEFVGWDQSDGRQPGTTVDLSAAGATGGSTAYSTISSTATMQVTATAAPPSFNVPTTADTVLENYADGNNSNGGNPGVISVPNLATGIVLGNAGGNAVSFSVSNPDGDLVNPAIDANGTLTFQLAQNKYGTATLNVTAQNGALTSATETTHVVIEQTTPPSFTATSEAVIENAGPATYTNWPQNVSPGTNGNGGALSYNVVDQADPGLFRVLPSVDASGTLTFTPVANAMGKATFSATAYNALTKLFSAPETFTIGIYAPPTTAPESYVIDYSSGSSATASDGVLSHDTDPNSSFDGGAMTATAVNHGSDGNVYLNADGSFTYYPSSGVFAGYDQISYQAAVGPAVSPTQTVTLYSHEGAMVEKLYTQVLKRDAGGSEVMNWAPQLHSGSLPMTTFGGDVIESAENLNSIVAGFFYGFLGRGPSSSDLSYWDSVWINNGGPEQVIIGIAGTQECFNHAQTQYFYGDGNSNWVALAYQQILGRAVDSSSLSYFTGKLDSGAMTRSQVAQTLVTSNEYRTDMINNYYSQYLGRAPSSSDQQYWLGQMSNGTTQLSLQETLIASGEYFNNPQAAVYDSSIGRYDVNLWTY